MRQFTYFNNSIIGDRGHTNATLDIDDDGEADINAYWYSYNDSEYGEHTDNQVKEMWAHYFSFGITGSDEAMTSMRNSFKETMQRYDEMASVMSEYE